MHHYDYRCESCSQRFTLSYRTYADFDAAEPICPVCGATELSRLISQVAIPKADRDYNKMSSGEMLSVLESGDEGQVENMFKQVGAEPPVSVPKIADSPD